MGWTVLYLAFGVVALWLLGEVLLQYKARLRWRLVAFFGFLGVVVGVLLPSVPVIAGGTVAFAIGQTFVTLSFRRGFSTGWALGGKPGTSRRRRENQGEMQPLDPVTDDGPADPAGYDAYPPASAPAPQPEPEPYQEPYQGDYQDDYQGQYPRQQERPGEPEPSGGYAGGAYPDAGPYQQPAPAGYTAAYPTPEQDRYADPLTDPLTDPLADPLTGPAGYPGQPAAEPYDPAYAAYADPYGAGAPATAGAGGGQPYGDYGTGPVPQPGFPADPPPDPRFQQQPYAATYAGDYAAGAGLSSDPGSEAAWSTEPHYPDTPPGGVWMPQQRDHVPPADPAAEHGYGQPPAAPYPQADGYGAPGAQGQGGYYFDQGQQY